MKNSTIIVLVVLVAVGVAAYFLLNKKSTITTTGTTTTSSTKSGVAALFDTDALISLFSRNKNNTSNNSDVSNDTKTALNITSMVNGF